MAVEPSLPSAVVDGARVVGRYEFLPDATGQRLAEGGLRLSGSRKKSLPDLPLVSVITVCKNAAGTIAQCMASVIAQTYPNIEHIIIDAGSSDHTLALIKQNAATIAYFVSEPDRGLYHAMNKGLAVAAGDYILFLNSDDWYVESAIQELVAAKHYSGADFVSALAQYVGEKGKKVNVLRHMPFDSGIRLRMPLRHETMLVPAALYDKFGGYDESYRIIADLDLAIRLFDGACTHYEVPRPLLFFRTTGVSNTEKARLLEERNAIIRNQFPFLSETESNSLADQAGLSPDSVESLARVHSRHLDFFLALEAYADDRSSAAGASPWKDGFIDWHAARKSAGLPLVSVILPIYNAQATLAECLDSVLAQTLAEFELLCINDCSPDESQRIVDQYAQRDQRVVSCPNPGNLGLGRTRNRGIVLARGRYVFHIDPDDTIPPDALRMLYSHAIEHHSDMVRGGFLHQQFILGQASVKADRRGLPDGAPPIIGTKLSKNPELLATTEGHWSFLYKREFARNVPYPSDLTMGQDSIFLVKALAQAERITVISDLVYHYRANANSAMNTYRFEKYMDELEWRRRAWHVLQDAKLPAIGNRLARAYWNRAFFHSAASKLDAVQMTRFLDKFRQLFSETGTRSLTDKVPPFFQRLFPLILAGKDGKAIELMLAAPDGDLRGGKRKKPRKKWRWTLRGLLAGVLRRQGKPGKEEGK